MLAAETTGDLGIWVALDVAPPMSADEKSRQIGRIELSRKTRAPSLSANGAQPNRANTGLSQVCGGSRRKRASAPAKVA